MVERILLSAMSRASAESAAVVLDIVRLVCDPATSSLCSLSPHLSPRCRGSRSYDNAGSPRSTINWSTSAWAAGDNPRAVLSELTAAWSSPAAC